MPLARCRACWIASNSLTFAEHFQVAGRERRANWPDFKSVGPVSPTHFGHFPPNPPQLPHNPHEGHQSEVAGHNPEDLMLCPPQGQSRSGHDFHQGAVTFRLGTDQTSRGQIQHQTATFRVFNENLVEQGFLSL